MCTLLQRSQPVVLAMLGLTTLDNIAQLGVQATSLTDSPQEQQNQTAKILITLIITLAVSLLTCNSVQMRLQYAFYTAVAQMWQGLAYMLSCLTRQTPAPMEIDHEGPATITKVQYASICPECHEGSSVSTENVGKTSQNWHCAFKYQGMDLGPCSRLFQASPENSDKHGSVIKCSFVAKQSTKTVSLLKRNSSQTLRHS